MIKQCMCVALAVSVLGTAACNSGGGARLSNFQDSSSYAIGMNMGTSLKRTQADVDVGALVQGLRDVLEDRDGRLTQDQAAAVLQQLTQELEQGAAEAREMLSERNQQEGNTFREENGARDAVTTTRSGLQYEVLEQGSGPKPTAASRVRVHYRGTLVDGKEFDSSYGRDPVSFRLNGVIPGWTEALQLMPVGSKYRIVLPPELGYGARGAPPDIGPHATLIFDVELLGIEN